MTSRTVTLGLLGVAAGAGLASDGSTTLGVLALASVAAVFAVPPSGRPALGVGLAAVALAVGAASTVGGPDDPLVLVAVVALTGAGVIVGIRGRTWPALARRYDRATPGTDPAEDMWRALDRGEDPTVGDAPDGDDRGQGRASVD